MVGRNCQGDEERHGSFRRQRKRWQTSKRLQTCSTYDVFGIKMDFIRKARMCARGDQTAPPETLTYVSVVSRESVRIAFTAAALNDLDIKMFDVGNAYLNAPTAE